MFFKQTAACNQPNSMSPISGRDIRRQNRVLSRGGASFDNGNRALFGLVDRLGGNSPVASSGNAGVATTGAWSPTALPTVPAAAAVRASGSSAGVNGGGSVDAMDGAAPCVVPTVVRFSRLVPVPVVATPVARPVTPKAPAAAAPTPAPVVAAAPKAPCVDPPECRPTPDNICRLIQEGCIKPSQVSRGQILACSWSGWTGVNVKPGMCSVKGWNNGEYLGTLNPRPLNRAGLWYDPPPVYQMAMDAGMNTPNGLSGVMDQLTGPGAPAIWGAIALGGFALFAASQLDKKARR